MKQLNNITKRLLITNLNFSINFFDANSLEILELFIASEGVLRDVKNNLKDSSILFVFIDPLLLCARSLKND